MSHHMHKSYCAAGIEVFLHFVEIVDELTINQLKRKHVSRNERNIGTKVPNLMCD